MEILSNVSSGKYKFGKMDIQENRNMAQNAWQDSAIVGNDRTQFVKITIEELYYLKEIFLTSYIKI